MNIEDMKTSKTMNIRAIAMMIMAMVFSLQANAVLKEENLDKTLAILKNELTTQYEEISTRTARQKARSQDMHNRIMEVWRMSNQNALMFYSQK